MAVAAAAEAVAPVALGVAVAAAGVVVVLIVVVTVLVLVVAGNCIASSVSSMSSSRSSHHVCSVRSATEWCSTASKPATEVSCCYNGTVHTHRHCNETEAESRTRNI